MLSESNVTEVCKRSCRQPGESQSDHATTAPSWSWASIEGRIKFQSFGQKVTPLVTVLSAKMTAANSDPFGEVRSGHLFLSARLVALDALPSKTLLYRDDFLRVSLESSPDTRDGRLYLLPLLKLDREDQYWSLLLERKKRSGLIPVVQEYQRLGVVSMFVKRRSSGLLTAQSAELPTGWPQVFREGLEGAMSTFVEEEGITSGNTCIICLS
jgi:hypothetical protein